MKPSLRDAIRDIYQQLLFACDVVFARENRAAFAKFQVRFSMYTQTQVRGPPNIALALGCKLLKH